MGALNSRLLGEYFDGVTSNSPMKADNYSHHRVLEVDPRSPSSEITRTPIQVDKSPLTLSHQSIVDPRSPSCGISRTPLYPAVEQDNAAVRPNVARHIPLDLDQNDTSLSTNGNDSSDFLDLSDPSSDMHSSMSSPSVLSVDDLDLPDMPEESDGEEELQRSISDPELAADQICLLDRRQSDSGLEFNLKTFHQSFRKRCSSKAKQMVSKISPNKSKSVSTPSNINQDTKTRRSLGDITALRSPLATKNVDVNSPLAIVQRKQASKLNVFRRHSTPDGKTGYVKKYNMMAYEEKENLPFDC